MSLISLNVTSRQERNQKIFLEGVQKIFLRSFTQVFVLVANSKGT